MEGEKAERGYASARRNSLKCEECPQKVLEQEVFLLKERGTHPSKEIFVAV